MRKEKKKAETKERTRSCEGSEGRRKEKKTQEEENVLSKYK